MPELRLALLAGTGRLGREVRRVSAYDPTTPGRGLAGGELVVAGEVPASPAETAHLVRALATNGAAALVLSPRPPVAEPGPDDVPYPLVEACVRAGLPLFLAPHSIPAVRIAEVVAHRMARESDPATEHSPSRQTRLLTALTNGADTQALLTILSTELAAPCHVITPSGRLSATATPTPEGTTATGWNGSADAGGAGSSRDGGANGAVRPSEEPRADGSAEVTPLARPPRGPSGEAGGTAGQPTGAGARASAGPRETTDSRDVVVPNGVGAAGGASRSSEGPGLDGSAEVTPLARPPRGASGEAGEIAGPPGGAGARASAGPRWRPGSRDVVGAGGVGAVVGVRVVGRSGAGARAEGAALGESRPAGGSLGEPGGGEVAPAEVAALGEGSPGGRSLGRSGCGEVARVMARGGGGVPVLVGGDTVFAVGRGAGLVGYLVCGGDRRTDEALARVADLFVLGDARRAERAAVEAAHAWELVDLVESDAAPDTIRARLSAAGLPPDAAPIVCSAAGHGADAATARLVIDLIEHALDEEPTARWVVAVGKAEVVVFASAGTGPGGATRVARALERAADWWEPLLGAERLAIGVAGTSPTWGTALAEARGARDLAWTRPGRLTVAEGPEIDAYPALLTAVPPPVRAAFAERVLGGLRAYDAEHGTDLIDTLAAFLAANGAWQRCAGALGVHVSALHQRMGRVRDLTGRDLFSARDRVDLLLALETDPAG
ncbi:helix-turn-helix domain-containing protein [Embleya sp. NPDC020630]|uniref:helix-turn-helix domain-containing protein n=1 Tax=Embleya sp. NPDC020630 TaxID=3363979 RepID=UPI0037BCAD2F